MKIVIADSAAHAIENNRRSRQLWHSFDSAEAHYQDRAKHKYNVLCAVADAQFELQQIANQYRIRPPVIRHWMRAVDDVARHDWLPALIDVDVEPRLFDNGAPTIDFAAALNELVETIDQIIDEKRATDDGDCGFMTQQAAAYFELSESLRKCRTVAQKLNEVTL